MKHYYLHLWASGEFDAETKIIDRNIHPPKIADLGLELSNWPEDDLFQTWPAYFASNRLCAKIENSNLTGAKCLPVNRIKGDFNFNALYPDFSPDRYFQLEFGDQVGKDDFALYKQLYLIVSEQALVFLRNNHVTHAESDLINGTFDEYFTSEKKYFWMTERGKAYFIAMDKKKQ
jgi:hypothetical protein